MDIIAEFKEEFGPCIERNDPGADGAERQFASERKRLIRRRVCGICDGLPSAPQGSDDGILCKFAHGE